MRKKREREKKKNGVPGAAEAEEKIESPVMVNKERKAGIPRTLADAKGRSGWQ